MDVASALFGPKGRDLDHYAIQVEDLFKTFLEKNIKSAIELLSIERNTLFIDFKDVELFDQDLAVGIIQNYYRFYRYLCRAVETFVREAQIEKHQIRNKNYFVGFYNVAHIETIRELSSKRIGTLTRISGQVIRSHPVHPELIVGCFECEDCLTQQFKEQQFRYTLPSNCANDNCQNRTRYKLITPKSQFTDFQKLRIQETQRDLPRGSPPRSLDVIIRGGDVVETIQPGDEVDFIGMLIAMPNVGQMMSGAFGTVATELSHDSGVVGLKSLGIKELTHSLAFWATSCVRHGQSKPSLNVESFEAEDETFFSDYEKERVQQISSDPDLLKNLSESLFAAIYGSEDVKQAILLQLLGGVAKTTAEGMKLRGDINVLLVGDPSTAKSQLLKIVAEIAPLKTIYTSGKASSAAGLTASVVRDTDGGFVVEAGALMLADRGICCIDEFDKMERKDQVAIHEAMEQQTVTITKAGISATLNARASVLAAANPIGGKYDITRDLKSNINLSLPILSRFDLFFVLIDPHDSELDKKIAERILTMRYTQGDPNLNKDLMKYSFEDIKLYIRYAKALKPKLPIGIETVIAQEYNRLRKLYAGSRRAWRITIRQAEAIIRLSEAIAKAHLEKFVKPEYVRMAARLIERTQVQMGTTEVNLDENVGDVKLDAPERMKVDSQDVGGTQTDSVEGSKIDLHKYIQVSKLLVSRLNYGDSEEPLTKINLIDWYLGECIDHIDTEQQLIEAKQMCEKLINRLIKKDNILIELHQDGNIADEHNEENIVILNPNVDVDEHFDSLGK